MTHNEHDTGHDPASRSCDAAMGSAFPPVRIVLLIYALGDRGVLTSCCRADWTPALASIASAMQRHLARGCADLHVGDDAAHCRLIETFDSEDACEVLGDDLGLDDHGRRRCLVATDEWSIDEAVDTCPGGQLTMT